MIHAFPTKLRGPVVTLLTVGVAVPFIWHGLVLGRTPRVTAGAAHRQVAAGTHVLVDVAVKPELARHLGQAVPWPAASILLAQSADAVPAELKGRSLLLLCDDGLRSAPAARHLQNLGLDAASVRGGAQQYLAAVPGCSRAVLLHPDPATDAAIPAFRTSPPFEQWAVVAAFFGIKLGYSVLSVVIVVVLWRRPEADLAALRWAMGLFLAGEMCCFFNVMACFEDSVLLEHLHSVGMVCSLGFASYALLEGLDTRLIHFTGKGRCAAVELCRACDKGAAGCALRRMFFLLIPATAVLAALPLCSELRTGVCNTRVLGVLHSYRHPVVHQLYELRYLPMAAIGLLAVCFLVLWRVERQSVTASKILYSAALGAVGFSFSRLLMVASFADHQVWFVVWEETSELLYVGFVGWVLLVFAKGLLTRAPVSTAHGQPRVSLDLEAHPGRVGVPADRPPREPAASEREARPARSRLRSASYGSQARALPADVQPPQQPPTTPGSIGQEAAT